MRGRGRYEGVAGLYSGLLPTFAMAVPANVLYFMLYETFRDQLRGAVGGGGRRSVGFPDCQHC